MAAPGFQPSEERKKEGRPNDPKPFLKGNGCSRAQPLSCTSRRQSKWQEARLPSSRSIRTISWSVGVPPAIERVTSTLIHHCKHLSKSEFMAGKCWIQETVNVLLPLPLRFLSTKLSGGIRHCTGCHSSLQGSFLPLGINLILEERSLPLQGPIMFSRV